MGWTWDVGAPMNTSLKIYIYIERRTKKNEECFHPSADSRASHVANLEQPQTPTKNKLTYLLQFIEAMDFRSSSSLSFIPIHIFYTRLDCNLIRSMEDEKSFLMVSSG